VESNKNFVAVTQTGAACLGAGSPWTTLAAIGTNHALWQNPALAAGGSDARSAFRPNPAPMTQLAQMSAELLPTALVTRKQTTNVQKTRIDAGGYGAMGPYPERERPA
jgi:hypothetical protein